MDKIELNLPDVADETHVDLYSVLDWVGMSEVEIPIRWQDKTGTAWNIPARVLAQVSLDKSGSRGIHMSRLYLLLQESLPKQNLTAGLLKDLSFEFLKSHENLSSSARLQVDVEIPLLKKSLKSGLNSWRYYPVKWLMENKKGQIHLWTEVKVAYSSTCPASAALSRQLIQENFKAHFLGEELNFSDVSQWLGSTQGIIATPHAQRSLATVRILTAVEREFDPADLVDLIEETLQTAVQGVVKREDEQEFALRNGQNLMFCEDAARRLQLALKARPEIVDFELKVEHIESLHPHNAVSIASRK